MKNGGPVLCQHFSYSICLPWHPGTSAFKSITLSTVMISIALLLGIEEATADLERENAERLWQEGLLRRVPVVGRVVGWWAPPPPAPPGRRLHLHNGTLQPTDDMYRYWSQWQVYFMGV